MSPPLRSNTNVQKSNRPTAVLLSAHAYPAPAIGGRRVSELANHLAACGWEVHVIAKAGPFPASGGELSSAVRRHNVPFPMPLGSLIVEPFRRLRGRKNDAVSSAPLKPAVASGKQSPSFLARLRFHYFRYTVAVDNHKRWSLRATRTLAKLILSRRLPVVFASGPPFSPLAAACVAARALRTPIVIDMRDPWLDLSRLSSHPQYPGFRRRVDQFLERACVRGAARIVTTSSRLTAQLRDRYPRFSDKIVTVRNGYEDDKLMPPVSRCGRLIMLYAGSIYLNRNPLPFLAALARLIDSRAIDPARVAVTLVGHCRRWNSIDIGERVAAHGLSNVVTILDPVPASDVTKLTSQANVLLNFAQDQKDAVPAKLFEQIASRRQILLFTEPDSESAFVAREVKQVVRVDSTDPTSIETAILRLYRQWADDSRPDESFAESELDIEHLSRKRTNERLEELLRVCLKK